MPRSNQTAHGGTSSDGVGGSIYAIAGDPIEEFTVREDTRHNGQRLSFDAQGQDISLSLKPQVVELLRKYHSMFVIGFGVPK